MTANAARTTNWRTSRATPPRARSSDCWTAARTGARPVLTLTAWRAGRAALIDGDRPGRAWISPGRSAGTTWSRATPARQVRSRWGIRPRVRRSAGSTMNGPCEASDPWSTLPWRSSGSPSQYGSPGSADHVPVTTTVSKGVVAPGTEASTRLRVSPSPRPRAFAAGTDSVASTGLRPAIGQRPAARFA